ncbi:methyltransferase [Zhihengliuella sp.]|uniref:class I SAM-dependent methyltransferase n=1 Tax=Zhihengliuella sp. TaxID=1954483 RepID=UPI00281247ED|nr:methyltransferase [Zhihengliuella sp.]
MSDFVPGTGWPLDVFAGLRRRPDVEAENLFAHDAADRLLLETAAEQYPGRIGDGARVAVLGDQYGALALGLAAAGVRGHRVHQDGRSGELALEANADEAGLGGTFAAIEEASAAVAGARLVLLQLPRSLDVLSEWARLIAAAGGEDVVVLAGGRVKHMALAMNDALGTYFGSVRAGLASRKARVLTATEPLREAALAAPDPVEAGTADAGLPTPLQLRAVPGSFGGARLDPGTRFLLPRLVGPDGLPERLPGGGPVVDLGCGNGTIAAFLALTRPELRVLACDQSTAAVTASRLTAEANGVSARVEVRRADGLDGLDDGSVAAVVLNPPFHMGSTVHPGIALKLFADAGRALAPGGRLWCVWNSHLQYRRHLERLVGPTRQLDRNSKFTVTVSTRRA